MLLTQSVHVLALTLLAAVQDGESSVNWPGFRGPGARGVSQGPVPPESFDLESGHNLLWRTAVPGLAHSSPVVWGDRLFVTSAVRVGAESELSSLYGSPGYGAGEPVPDEGRHRFIVLCLDKRSGELIWQRTAYEGTPIVPRHPKATHANSTPAVDGRRVVACFGSEGLFAFDLDGQLLWKRDLGRLDVGAPGNPREMPWGYASSPTLHGDKVLVQCDMEGDSFLTALSAETGEELWRVAREEDSTWSSPTVHVTSERAQVIVNGYKNIGGYDLESGEQLWKLEGGGDVPVPTPVVAHGLIYLTSAHGRSRPLRAIGVDASGELDGYDLVWNHERMGIYMQTPLVLGDLLYACSDGGVLGCFDAITGELVYRERMGDGKTGFTSSAVACGDRIWWVGEDGEVLCVRHGPEFEVLARSRLGENCLATPAISAGVLYFRTRRGVVAVGASD